MVLLSGITQEAIVSMFIIMLSMPFFIAGIITFIIFMFRFFFDIVEPINYLKLYFTILAILVIFIIILILFSMLVNYLRSIS
jgi:hypothetical protein